MSDDGREPLTEGQVAALQNLARKQAGEAVDWINIADARRLTEFGLAERNREGWTITAAGRAAVALDRADPGSAGLDPSEPQPQGANE